MKKRTAAYLIVMLLGGCAQLAVKDPKVEGARQLEEMQIKGEKQALAEAKKMLKEQRDFILDVSGPKLCVREKEEKHTGLEYNGTIEETFTGSYIEGADLYASKLPLGTKIHSKISTSEEYLYAESGILYRCMYYNGS